MEKERRIQELRAAYLVEAHPQALHLTWSALAGRATIASQNDLDFVLAKVRQEIASHLLSGSTVIVE
jgi:hypothetical protein